MISGTPVQIISSGVLCVTSDVLSFGVRRRYLITKIVIAPTTMMKKIVVMIKMTFHAQSTSTARLDADLGSRKVASPASRGRGFMRSS